MRKSSVFVNAEVDVERYQAHHVAVALHFDEALSSCPHSAASYAYCFLPVMLYPRYNKLDLIRHAKGLERNVYCIAYRSADSLELVRVPHTHEVRRVYHLHALCSRLFLCYFVLFLQHFNSYNFALLELFCIKFHCQLRLSAFAIYAKNIDMRLQRSAFFFTQIIAVFHNIRRFDMVNVVSSALVQNWRPPICQSAAV